METFIFDPEDLAAVILDLAADEPPVQPDPYYEEKEQNEKTKKHKGMISAVIAYEDGHVSIHDSAAKQVGTKFESGFYTASTDNNGRLIIEQSKLQEIHKPYTTSENIRIMNVVDGFFGEGVMEKINQLEFIHKLGILLHGEQGTAKTAVMHFIAEKLRIEKNAIVFFCNSQNNLGSAINLSGMIREIQDNPIVFIADEFDRYVKNSESEMKNFLDGNSSINNMLFLAATNYIDLIPDTLKDRPSRFKVVEKMLGITDKELMSTVIRNISTRISPSLFTEDEIQDVVKGLEYVTMDELKHICLDKATATFIVKETKAGIGFLGSLIRRTIEDKPAPVYTQMTWFAPSPIKPSNSPTNI